MLHDTVRLRQAAEASRAHGLHDNALFLAERAHAAVAVAPHDGAEGFEFERTAALLATVLLEQRCANRALYVLQTAGADRSAALPLRVLYARACRALGALGDAERCLSQCDAALNDPSGMALCLLADICREGNRTSLARKYYQQALERNPFLWCAYQALCDLGAPDEDNERYASVCDPAKYFSRPELMVPPPSSGNTENVAPAVSIAMSMATPDHLDMTAARKPPAVQQQPRISAFAAAVAAAAPPSGVHSSKQDQRSRRSDAGDDFVLHRRGMRGVDGPPPRVSLFATTPRTPLTPNLGTIPLLETTGAVRSLSFVTPDASNTSGGDTAAGTGAGVTPALLRGVGRETKRPTRAVAGRLFEREDEEADVSVAEDSVFASPGSLRRSRRLQQKTMVTTTPAAVSGSASNCGGGGAGEGVDETPSMWPAEVRAPRRALGKGRRRLDEEDEEGGEENEEEDDDDDDDDDDHDDDDKDGRVDGKAHVVHEVSRSGEEGALWAVQLLGQVARAYQALSNYQCRDAVRLFGELPAVQKRTPWVLTRIARAHYEMADYRESARVFAQSHACDPHAQDHMEVYSTVLWHLQDDVRLSWLARELVASDRMAPQAWCVVGNCFSVHKEHELAIRFFKRVLQLDPSFTYAHTLLGHEFAYVEDFDRAIASFRKALLIDAQHYNAWYGLGMIFYRQEKYQLAEFHFKRAFNVNPRNSVLCCYIAMALHARQQFPQALIMFDRAALIDPYNPLVRFRRAVLLYSMEKNEEALSELEDLLRIAPKESSIYFLMGKLHRKMGNADKSMMCFSWAMDLDPKGAHTSINTAADQNQLLDDDDDTAHQHTDDHDDDDDEGDEESDDELGWSD